VKDFVPITLASTTAVIIVTHPSLPVKSMKDLVALARARPGALSYASVGTGSPQHLAGELLNSVAKIDMAHIPFKGAAPALIDVLGGHVPVGFIALLPAVPHVKSGKLTALAVTTKERSSALPEVPTTAETGYPNVDLYQWYGVLAPAGTPREVTDKLAKDFVWALTLPDLREKLGRDGCDVVANSPQEFAAFIKSEIDKNARVIKAARVTAE
jgi:tripartite-type tricarboxylate transporter receptor subunit TctC